LEESKAGDLPCIFTKEKVESTKFRGRNESRHSSLVWERPDVGTV